VPARSESSSPGVLGAEGRYRLHESATEPLRLAGQDLVPIGPLRMYACGITPYDVTHVGHAATFVWADLVRSVARAHGIATEVTRNVTDVDDVLTRAAATRGVHFDELALTQEFLFDRDMRALSVAPPTTTPHARNHVASVVRLAAALLAAGAAYERDGFVYFRGAEVPARADLGEEHALRLSTEYGDQADVPDRDSVFDVPVWRPSPPDHPAWPSPWGWGRPGWHAECAAMAVGTVGSSVDVLVGGADLTFPHHAYQEAMAEAATGVRPFARAVLHVGEVRVDGHKMSKSAGTLVLVDDLLERFGPGVIRLALLNRRWREPWECEDRVFVEAESLLAELLAAAEGGGSTARPDDAVLARLRDDLDVPASMEVALGGSGPQAARTVVEVLKLVPPT
jgi:cysteinyl-tRNA synthetase